MDSIHDAAALERLRGKWRIEPYYLRQARNSFYKKQRTAAEALREIPEAQRAAFGGAIGFHALKLHGRHDSRLDGATKLIFRTARGQLIESVILRIASGRTSLCVSSQVGCAARCEFCATGHMGVAIHLSRAEILDQVIQANQLLSAEGRSVRNVVFMGMGEPLRCNETEVYEGDGNPPVAPLLRPVSPARVVVHGRHTRPWCGARGRFRAGHGGSACTARGRSSANASCLWRGAIPSTCSGRRW